MIVVDASVLVKVLIDDTIAGDRAREVLAGDADWAAPEHQLIEVIAAIRGRWLGGHLSADRAHAALDDLGRLVFTSVPTSRVMDRVWELRHDLTAYDAAYVAAAEWLDCTLVTDDRRLAAAPDVRCDLRTTD